LLWGLEGAVWLLPLSGLFMSVMYPTLNSKGISCFPKSQHGAAAGVILFFTAAAAALGPLAMAAVIDANQSTRSGFVLATALAFLLFACSLGNWLTNPAQRRLQASDRQDYGADGGSPAASDAVAPSP
jgi:fucose permease